MQSAAEVNSEMVLSKKTADKDEEEEEEMRDQSKSKSAKQQPKRNQKDSVGKAMADLIRVSEDPAIGAKKKGPKGVVFEPKQTIVSEVSSE